LIVALAAALLVADVASAHDSFPALFAQAEAEAEAPSSPSFIIDALIFFALVVGAVFAICRAGRRN
jgi:hypothetical protein